MHNLALALNDKEGYQITGSDDEFFDPSKSRLAAAGLLPEKAGWFPERITPDLDAVILGMHAREDNPELIKAKELGMCVTAHCEDLFLADGGRRGGTVRRGPHARRGACRGKENQRF